jgi:hypothetical protein
VNQSQRVVFLDIDGVLINRRALVERRSLSQRADPDCVAALNHITDETGAVIVVSSSWRLDYSVEELVDLLKAWGVTGSVVGKTPALDRDSVRGDEIAAWMKERDVQVSDVVILDDDADMRWLAPRLVQTDFKPGLTMVQAKRAIEVLRSTDALISGSVESVLYTAADVVAVWEQCKDPVVLDRAISRLREEQRRAAGLCVSCGSVLLEPAHGNSGRCSNAECTRMTV